MMVGIHLAKILRRVHLASTQPSKVVSFFDALLPGTAASGERDCKAVCRLRQAHSLQLTYMVSPVKSGSDFRL
jgi:hypothetical protein